MDRLRIADHGHPGGIIEWCRSHGYEAAAFGTDGFGARQGIILSRDLADGSHENLAATLDQVLVWDGENIVVEDDTGA